MTKTLTAKYGSTEAARNAHEDLVSTGYPNEKVYVDADAAEVKVITSVDGAREAREILGRHKPDQVTEGEI